MSLFKVKPGKKVWIVYTGNPQHPRIYAQYHQHHDYNAEMKARKEANQLNKKVGL